MADNTLTIEVIGRDQDRLAADDLVKALQSATSLLRQLDQSRNLSGTPRAEWVVVSASMMSPMTITLRGDSTSDEILPDDVVSPLIDSLRMIEENRGPRDFNNRMLQDVSRLGRLLSNGVASLTFTTPGEKPFRPTERMPAHADRIRKARSRHYEALTTLEGTLEKIDVHGRPEFYIYERLSGDEVRCFFAIDVASELGPLITKRVRVQGTAKFRRDDHSPVSMEVDRFSSVSETPPSIAAIHAFGVDITGGTTSEEFVRKMRDD